MPVQRAPRGGCEAAARYRLAAMNDAMPRGELMRLATAGSVDDGKSTLIGRLLYDSKALMSDQLAEAEVDLANITDGLRAEREQGITIDVAYRFFATPRRSFIIADTPGHVRYTRNMVTGASTADAAVVLIDARNGIVEQSRRHAYISALLGIRHLIACVNKMDLVDYDEARFREIEAEFARDGRAARRRRRPRDPDLGAAGRQRRQRLRAHAVVLGSRRWSRSSRSSRSPPSATSATCACRSSGSCATPTTAATRASSRAAS